MTRGLQTRRPAAPKPDRVVVSETGPEPDWWPEAIATQRCLEGRDGPRPTVSAAMFIAGEIAILSLAYDEACAVLARGRPLSPERRRDIALVIIAQARRGLLDPRRLALKAIVKAG